MPIPTENLSFQAFSRVAIAALAALFMSLVWGSERPPLDPSQPQSPAWMQGLVIYEIAPKEFTSPNGPESGTFASLQERLPYLQSLGITGIWLAGYALADQKHFFNIWMCYASIEPDQLDPSLGTPEQFKAMIDEAHRRGIRIFLDVTTHGLMSDSRVVMQHPQWFRGSSWGMVDFDWNGGHTDLDDWWVHVWSDYVAQYGVDGFRLDLSIHNRPDLWERIRRNAAALNHPIAIFEENPSGAIPGVTDFAENDNDIFQRLSSETEEWSNEPNPVLADDIPGFYARKFGHQGSYNVELHYAGDANTQVTRGDSTLKVKLEGMGPDRASRRYGDSTGADDFEMYAIAQNVPAADGIPDVMLSVDGVADRLVENIVVTDGAGNTWELRGDARILTAEGKAPHLKLHLPTVGPQESITLSIHDIGFRTDVAPTNSPNNNPYVARGSRSLFGYSFLLTPMIPLFMSGEEFDASFRPIPRMSSDLFGRDPGRGRMLYGNWIDWAELELPEHRAMLEDVKRILAIRKREWGVLAPQVPGSVEPNVVAVPYQTDIKVPIPYMRWVGGAGIVVLGNRRTDADAHVRLSVPVDKMGGGPNSRYRVADIWRGKRPRIYSAKQLTDIPYIVGRDRISRGGVGMLKVELVH